MRTLNCSGGLGPPRALSETPALIERRYRARNLVLTQALQPRCLMANRRRAFRVCVKTQVACHPEEPRSDRGDEGSPQFLDFTSHQKLQRSFAALRMTCQASSQTDSLGPEATSLQGLKPSKSRPFATAGPKPRPSRYSRILHGIPSANSNGRYCTVNVRPMEWLRAGLHEMQVPVTASG